MVNYQSVSGRSVLLLFLSTVVVFVFLFQSLANNSFLAEEVKVNANYCAYKCHNGLCLSEIGLVCDQRDDCGDNSDEFHCGIDCSLDNDLFSCNDNSSCLTLSMVCDGVFNCNDGSDESNLCSDSPCSALECPSSRCIQLPDGPQCHCGKNFLLITDQQNGSSSCQDIDECLIFGICSHTCTNLVGSYRCDCWPGFLLQSDNWSCAPAYESISSLIIYSTSNAFWKYTPESESDIEIIGDLNGRISSPHAVLDWWTGNVYVPDSAAKKILVCTGAKQSKCHAVISRGLEDPRELALHSFTGRMFWTDCGREAHIGVAFMDGQEQRVLIERGLQMPMGLTIDYVSERLYFYDSLDRSLQSVNLNGGDRQSIPTPSPQWSPQSVQVLGDKLYWSECCGKECTLGSMDKFTGQLQKTLLTKPSLRLLVAYHPLIQRRIPDHLNPCTPSPCPSFCLLAGNGNYTCVRDDKENSTVGGISGGGSEVYLVFEYSLILVVFIIILLIVC